MTSAPDPRKPIFPPMWFLLSALLMLCLHFLAPIRQIIFAPYRYVGAALLLAGLAVVLSIKGIFRRAGTTIKPFEVSSTLVVDGLYRVTRNPIYVALVVGLIGIAIMAGSITPFFVVPAFMYLIDRRFIRAEEAILEKTFGPRYSEYKSTVRRWL